MENRRDGEEMVCFCYAVRLKEILAAIDRGASTIHEIRVELGATLGCGGCESEVLDLLSNHVKENRPNSSIKPS